MAYVQDRVVHDADSHLMELEDCLDPYFEKAFLGAYHDLPSYRHKVGDRRWSDTARRRQADPAFRAGENDNIMLRKNYEALGSFLRDDRPKTMDLLGFASQLVFTTFCLSNFGLDEKGPVDLCYAAAQAHNRMMTDFCSVDRRLLATAYVPLVDFGRAAATARRAVAHARKHGQGRRNRAPEGGKGRKRPGSADR